MKKKTNILTLEMDDEVLEQMPEWYKLLRNSYESEAEKREMAK